MNCKPGDLAVVITPGPWQGLLVSVLHGAPCVEFRLPDGQLHQPARPGCWVIESLGRDFNANVFLGADVMARKARFGVSHDRHLCPIRDADGEDEILRLVGLPANTPAQPVEA